MRFYLSREMCKIYKKKKWTQKMFTIPHHKKAKHKIYFKIALHIRFKNSELRQKDDNKPMLEI